MKKIHLLALCASCLTLACSTPSERAAGDLARRIAPQYSIRFKEIPSQEDTYKLYTEGEKIIIEGNNALAMSVGLNRYLNDCCGVTVSWYADEKTQLPSAQPLVAEPLTGKALVPRRFFLNYCTFGYTMPWWKWEQWEHFIDWMALHGINLPLAITGQEALWQELWRQHGLPDEEIRAYFTGPAYLPWHRMNNIDGVDGPLPQGWIDGQKELQKKMANPSPELITLFSGEKSQLDNFRGPRGLQGIVDDYELDLAKVDVPQAKGIDKAMEKFNTARASVFTEESPEHKQMREAGEKVQANIKKLQGGVTVDQKTGKERTMTEQEREGLLKETWDSMKTLEEKTDQYIAHATKNGTKTPHTPAGKARLAGAMEMKNLNDQMKDHLGREKSLEAEAARDKKMTERTNKLGKAAAAKLADMDKEVEKFAGMSQLEFHDSTTDSMAYGLNKCEYQAARVIAISAVEEAAMKGQIEGKDIQKQVIRNTNEIAKDPAFQKWVKNASETSRMKDLGKLSADEVRADFVKGMSKDLEKKADTKEKTKTAEKSKTTEKSKSKAPAKTEKTKTKTVKTP